MLARGRMMASRRVKSGASIEGNVKESRATMDEGRVVVRNALARALWHSGPGFGMSGESVKEAFQRDRPDMNVMAERVMMYLGRQGVSLISMDE